MIAPIVTKLRWGGGRITAAITELRFDDPHRDAPSDALKSQGCGRLLKRLQRLKVSAPVRFYEGALAEISKALYNPLDLPTGGAGDHDAAIKAVMMKYPAYTAEAALALTPSMIFKLLSDKKQEQGKSVLGKMLLRKK